MLANVIPVPKKIDYAEGTVAVKCAVSNAEPAWGEAVEAFCAAFQKIYKKPMVPGEGGILIQKDASLAPDAYRLDTRGGITVCASALEGLGYALVSILNAAEIEGDALVLDQALVEDHPDKDYRGLMIDLARQWHPFRTLLTYVDICYFTKTKYLHLHFIDDQRYTLPSKLYPNLMTEGECYTEEQIQTLNAYAKARGVVIVPEFEGIGHSAIFNDRYPEVFANELDGEGGTIVTEEGVTVTARNIVCAGKASATEASVALLKEIGELFPDAPYIHIGADEANIKAWNHCAACRNYMKAHHISDVYELYAEFAGRLARAVLEMGRTPIVWEGFPKQGAHHIPKETVVISWENKYNFTQDLLDDGFRIINCSWQPLYIVANPDHRWGPRHLIDWNIHRWEHWWEHSAATLNPVCIQPTDQLLGAQVCCWECTFEQELTPVMEHLPVVAEHCWNNRRTLTWSDYVHRQRPTRQKLAWLIQSYE